MKTDQSSEMYLIRYILLGCYFFYYFKYSYDKYVNTSETWKTLGSMQILL